MKYQNILFLKNSLKQITFETHLKELKFTDRHHILTIISTEADIFEAKGTTKEFDEGIQFWQEVCVQHYCQYLCDSNKENICLLHSVTVTKFWFSQICLHVIWSYVITSLKKLPTFLLLKNDTIVQGLLYKHRRCW